MNDHERQRFARVQALFDRAMDLPPAEREAFVRQEAGDDSALADEALLLLRGGDEGETLARDAAPGADPKTGDRVQSTATGELFDKLASAPKLDTKRYQLQGEIAHGGMGAVLRIHDAHLNRRLAMKVMLERRAPRDAEEQQLAHQLLGRFLEEAQVTSQLDHPGVVPVHELGLDQSGKVYFTMRLVKGRTTDEIFALARAGKGDWTTTRALEVILKICDTMSYAHDKGVLHRDLKPANVMVGRFGEVYVMDWGLAKVLGQEDRHDLRVRDEFASAASPLDTARKRDAESDESSSVVSMDGQKLGTPSYMAPEQARSEALDARADVYSIGAMVYELLTGRAPYVVPGVRKPAYRILDDLGEGPPTRIEQIAKGVPAELVAIVDKAMARDREHRYASTTELAKDVRAFLDQRAVEAYRTGALVELKLWVRRNKPLAASLAAAALTLVAGIAGTTIYAKEAKQQAAANAELAQQKTTLATNEAKAKDDALREKGRADGTVREFDQLAGVVRYDRVVANEKELYPAWPHKKEAMEAWLADVGMLLAMRPEIEATMASLRQRALPWSEAEQQRDKESHPRFSAWQALAPKVAALRRAQAVRQQPASFVEPWLPAAQAELGTAALHEFAKARWVREGDAETPRVWGEEALGLAAAREVVALVEVGDERMAICTACESLAWALFANGLDDAAVAAARRAIDAVAEDGEHKDAHRRDLADIQRAIAAAPAALLQAEQALEALQREVGTRQTWSFAPADEPQRFLHETLENLLGKLGSLEAKEKPAVDQRLAWAKQIEELSLHHPKTQHTWPVVRAAIAANAKYAGQTIELRDRDVLGLVPIGENPVTHLWEFYELRSAWHGKGDARQIVIPEHRPDGSIEVTGDTGIVFVLLPGGTFTMGSQKSDPDKPNYDPGAEGDETPHAVTLLPFFLARHEMTQGQWARLWTWDESDREPSREKAGQTNYVGGKITRAHPVETVDWTMCDTVLSRHGLELPTEAQWEYGCRGGTTTPWVVDLEKLVEVANVSDATAREGTSGWTYEEWRDGHVVHAPVGSFAMNGFGLYDVHGNVWEWCRDWYGDYGSERAGDGLRSGSGSSDRTYRGGSFSFAAGHARSAARNRNAPSIRVNGLGLRPTRTSRLPD